MLAEPFGAVAVAVAASAVLVPREYGQIVRSRAAVDETCFGYGWQVYCYCCDLHDFHFDVGAVARIWMLVVDGVGYP